MAKHRVVWNGEAVKSHLLAKADLAKKLLAEYVAAKAYQYCPKDTHALSNSISVIENNFGDAYVVQVGMFYAPFVELGHFDGLHNRGWIPGQFFLARALNDAADAWPEIVRESFFEGNVTNESRNNIGVVFS